MSLMRFRHGPRSELIGAFVLVTRFPPPSTSLPRDCLLELYEIKVKRLVEGQSPVSFILAQSPRLCCRCCCCWL